MFSLRKEDDGLSSGTSSDKILFSTSLELTRFVFQFLVFQFKKVEEVGSSLVPRLPHSGMKTFEVMRVWRTWYFFSHEHRQRLTRGRHHLNCAWAYPRLRTGKRVKVAGNLLHVSSYQGVTPSVECIVGFLFSPISIMSRLCRKDTRLSAQYIFTFWGSLGTRVGGEGGGLGEWTCFELGRLVNKGRSRIV